MMLKRMGRRGQRKWPGWSVDFAALKFQWGKIHCLCLWLLISWIFFDLVLVFLQSPVWLCVTWHGRMGQLLIYSLRNKLEIYVTLSIFLVFLIWRYYFIDYYFIEGNVYSWQKHSHLHLQTTSAIEMVQMLLNSVTPIYL